MTGRTCGTKSTILTVIRARRTSLVRGEEIARLATLADSFVLANIAVSWTLLAFFRVQEISQSTESTFVIIAVETIAG